MKPIIQNPKKAINKAFLKEKPLRSEIDGFKKTLITLMDSINDLESEEHAKTLVRDFLLDTYYKGEFEINTKDRKDLVIHNDKTSKSTVGVIIEAKRPSEKYDFPTKTNLNVKATQELVLYYLRERIEHENADIKHLVITNGYEWFVIDGSVFYEQVYKNTKLVKEFDKWRSGQKDSAKTELFYKDIAKPFLEANQAEIPVTYFDIKEFEAAIRNEDEKDDKKLIALYKLLSPVHLLKVPFANDSNSLDKNFYAELLHIIGLEEVKDKGKKVIQRKAKRDNGSLLESAIFILEERDKLTQLKNKERFGSDPKELAFNVALELCITWVNRILFLKLLESQLVAYNKGDKTYRFLNIDTVGDFDKLDSLFFSVLAKKPEERNERVKDAFAKVPYLNSSLFEQTGLEHVLSISMLKSEGLELFGSTVLKDDKSKRRKGEVDTLTYFFEFLEAYDFTSEGSEDIQEDSKTLINASVLGLIFEKINGYKDGSFFTPGFITMYMCRETLRKAVLQKFNEKYGWKCETMHDLKNENFDRNEANDLINSLRICDPAVGSGHFLVSALNELLSIKSELELLVDNDGLRLKNYTLEVVNDELIVSDVDHDFFEYKRGNAESQRVQETLFREKQTIIENCLFGVDINHNSVKICRLRLWIELLKNSYYTKESKLTELETLPNIDINIKTGNSLISRFDLDADLGKALKKSKWTISSYRLAVDSYRNAKSKDEKRAMQELIATIKGDFRSEIAHNDKRVKRLRVLSGELTTLSTQTQLFAMSKVEKEAFNKRVTELTSESRKLEAELEEIRSNKIYQNAFEWRFEFPEVLNDKGDFVGFDVVIGNPPYIRQEELSEFKGWFKENLALYTGTADIYIFFIERGFQIMRQSGHFAYIMPNKFMQAGYGKPAREFLLTQRILEVIDFGDQQVFEEATTYPLIFTASKQVPQMAFQSTQVKTLDFANGFDRYVKEVSNEILHVSLTSDTWIISDSKTQALLQRLVDNGKRIEDYLNGEAKRGVLTGLTEAFVIDTETRNHLIAEDAKSSKVIKPFLAGRNTKRYKVPKPDKYLILFPKGFTIRRNLPLDDPYHISGDLTTINEPPPRYGNMEIDDAWEWISGEYPAVSKYLLPFEAKAKARTDKGDYWWELRACDYYKEFDRPKIMYQVFQVKPCFMYDESGLFCNNSMWIIPTNDKVLLGVLNSKMGWWLISQYCTAIQNGYQLIWKYFGQIPIATGKLELRSAIDGKVNTILALKKADTSADTTALEAEIDGLVYGLYGLSEEEIGIVENI